MIKFFRKIRQNLLSEGKPGKPAWPTVRYLKYAIGEIILVVVGILIALGINNFNQKQIEIKKEAIALNNLILDLEEQSDFLKVYISGEKEFYESGLYLSEHYAKNKAFLMNDTLLSKLNLLGTRITFTPVNTTFKELVSTGNIGLIRNEKLKRKIMQYFNELERISTISSNNNTNLVDGLYNPLLFEQTVFIHKFKYREDYSNRIFNDLRIDQNRIFNSESLNNLYATSEETLKTPEKALNLFNLIQIRTLMASVQITKYTELQQEITELVNSIKLVAKKYANSDI